MGEVRWPLGPPPQHCGDLELRLWHLRYEWLKRWSKGPGLLFTRGTLRMIQANKFQTQKWFLREREVNKNFWNLSSTPTSFTSWLGKFTIEFLRQDGALAPTGLQTISREIVDLGTRSLDRWCQRHTNSLHSSLELEENSSAGDLALANIVMCRVWTGSWRHSNKHKKKITYKKDKCQSGEMSKISQMLNEGIKADSDAVLLTKQVTVHDTIASMHNTIASMHNTPERKWK